jgi:hypothetical protein
MIDNEVASLGFECGGSSAECKWRRGTSITLLMNDTTDSFNGDGSLFSTGRPASEVL